MNIVLQVMHQAQGKKFTFKWNNVFFKFQNVYWVFYELED